MDIATAGRGGRRTEDRRTGQRQHDRADTKKNTLKPHLKQQWVIPPDANAAFVAAMEDILEVYQRPYDPERPVVCLDESSKQLIAETRVPIAAKPGQPGRHDYEYRRNGTANLFMMFAPLEGWRHVKVTDRHTAVDYAQVLKELSDTHFPRLENRARPGQSQHPQASITLRSLSPRRSPPARRTVRVALHTQARELAGHGGVRTWRCLLPMPRSAHPRSADLEGGSRRLGS